MYMNRIKNLMAVAIVAVASVVATSANAALISGVTATTSSEITHGCCSDRDPVDMVNMGGLTAGGTHGVHDVVAANMWLSAGDGGFGGTDTDPWAMFDLGDVYKIDSFHVWNYNEAGAFATRGVDSVSVEYGTTAALGSTVAGINSFAIATGAASDPGEDFNGFAPFVGRYVKFDINSHHTGGDNNFYGLSEVQFFGELFTGGNAVPEPATATLALLGLGGLMTRRRRNA